MVAAEPRQRARMSHSWGRFPFSRRLGKEATREHPSSFRTLTVRQAGYSFRQQSNSKRHSHDDAVANYGKLTYYSRNQTLRRITDAQWEENRIRLSSYPNND